MKVALKPGAREDLVAIRAWSEDQWGLERTAEFIERLIEAIERLAERPLMGRSRNTFFEGLRSIRHGGYVIFYVIETGRPVVVAVIHERRNFAALEFADRMEGL